MWALSLKYHFCRNNNTLNVNSHVIMIYFDDTVMLKNFYAEMCRAGYSKKKNCIKTYLFTDFSKYMVTDTSYHCIPQSFGTVLKSQTYLARNLHRIRLFLDIIRNYYRKGLTHICRKYDD